jgi:type III secretion system YscQ/HrcQ family protein
MLERVRAGEDVPIKTHHSGDKDWRPLRLTEVKPKMADALSAFFARRSLPEMRFAGRAVRLQTARPLEAAEIAAPWCATIRIDGTAAELVLPHSLVDLVCRYADPAVAATALRLDHAALVMEFALRDALQDIEAALGWTIAFKSVAKGSGQRDGGREAFVPVALQLQSAGTFWCQLRLEPHHLLALSRHLDRISKPVPHHMDIPVPVHLRWAFVELTLAELHRLSPGDIILADQSCKQPGTAVAVFGEHLIAPVELLRTGYRFGGKPRLARGSGWEWMLDRTSRDAGGMGEGTASEVPVRLFFELGRLEVDRTEVAELKSGAMMALARPLEDGLDIVAGGVRIGRGQVTQVGDAVGIRVTRI